MVESSIPAKYILAYRIFSLPTFREPWTRVIEETYGLTKEKYNAYRSLLKNEPSGDFKGLIKDVTAFQTQSLIKAIDEKKNTILPPHI